MNYQKMDTKMIISILIIAFSLDFAQTQRQDPVKNDLIPIQLQGNVYPEAVVTKAASALVIEKVGAYVELMCKASGTPPINIIWFKRNIKIVEHIFPEINFLEESLGMTSVASKLVINYLLPRHQDTYRCEAQSGWSSSHVATRSWLVVSDQNARTMNFTQLIDAKSQLVHHRPTIIFWGTLILDIINTEAVLPCTFIGNPRPTFSWTGPAKKVIRNRGRFRKLPDGSLKIRFIQSDDKGLYTCHIKNSVGNDTAKTYLNPVPEHDPLLIH